MVWMQHPRFLTQSCASDSRLEQHVQAKLETLSHASSAGLPSSERASWEITSVGTHA